LAWSHGWLLLFEYGLAAALLAVGFSGYLVSFAGDFGVLIPSALSTPLVQAVTTPAGTILAAAPPSISSRHSRCVAVTVVLVRCRPLRSSTTSPWCSN
jgi:APA family basic amino acid/polyamine antiporter